MNLLRVVLFGALGLAVGLITLTMVACQAVVLSAALALSRLAHLFGGRTTLKPKPRESTSAHGRVIEGEYSVDESGRGRRRQDE